MPRLKKCQWEKQAISSAAFSAKASRTLSYSDRLKPVTKTWSCVAPLYCKRRESQSQLFGAWPDVVV